MYPAKTNIGYHTRLNADHTVKVTGGCFGGAIDQNTVDRLVNAHFTVKVRPSGHPVFVNKEGKEVNLYLTVDPSSTPQGKQALAAWRKEQTKRLAEQVASEQAQKEEIEDLMESLSHEEIIRRLRG